MSDEEKIIAIRNWAEEENPDFDLAFISSLEESLKEYECLTDAQAEALDNIIDRFHIDAEEWA